MCWIGLGLAIALGAYGTGWAADGQDRGLKTSTKAADAPVQTGSYNALVIGINGYKEPLPKLKTAVNDASAIGKVLEERYGFQVKYLLDQDATRSKILDAMIEYRNALGDNDSLLIYYAGHGYSDHEAEKAYWLPVDAESAMSPNRISADDLTTAVRVLAARHVLIVSDSCYSGGLSRGLDEPARSVVRPPTAFLRRMIGSRSRTLMASGGDEPVTDKGSEGHSVFAFAILRALEQANDTIFTATDLFYSSIRQQVAGMSSQVPQYTFIQNSGHDEGDFVFIRKAGVEAPKQEADQLPNLSSLDLKSLLGGDSGGGGSLDGGKIVSMAFPFLKSACDSGVSMSCYQVGAMYENGQGVDKDDAQAAAFYRKSCEGGAAMGCTHLGALFHNGAGVDRDEVKAVGYYRQGCEGGDSAGCTGLGTMYESGVGVDKDDVQAVAFYSKGCDGGNEDGCRAVKRLKP